MRLPVARFFVERIAAGVNSLAFSSKGSEERRQSWAARQKDTMTDCEIIIVNAHINCPYLGPRPAAVITDSVAAFFCKRIFAAFVVAEGGVEFSVMPRQCHTMQKPIVVHAGFVFLDDVEPDTFENVRI